MTDEELKAAQEAEALAALEAEKAEREAAEKAEADKKAKEAAEKNKPQISDAEAKLLKELMQHKKAAKEASDRAKALEDKYASIDLEKLMEAAKVAEEAEKAELERKGDYERLIAKQREAHAKEMEDLKNNLKAAKEAEKAATAAREAALAINAFSNSRFVLDNLTLTPNKAKALYGDHFEIEEGVIVGYDKPKGSHNRTKLVDGAGEPVSFDEAIKQIIDSDPDKEILIKANINSGAGSEGNRGNYKPREEKKNLTPFDKILEGLKDNKLL